MNDNQFIPLSGYEKLELSTQIIIQEAVKANLKVEVLDATDNFIRITDEFHTEYIKQATRTSRDTYISHHILANKLVSKIVLAEHGLPTPTGIVEKNIGAKIIYDDLPWHNALVVKPKSTNFGEGVTVFAQEIVYEEFEKALDLAFSYDEDIIIEKFYPGLEYRFLVIGDQVAAVLHREPANIKGDGQNTIENLVEAKNQDPRRGENYTRPLEKLRLDEYELNYLQKQRYSPDSIPNKDEIVYLRPNSNISTGGDSIDATDEMHPSYKDLALKATEAVQTKICGVDMIICDPTRSAAERDDFTIIEVNFNPSLHMHDYPYIGKNRKTGKKVLRYLNFDI